MPEEDEQPKYFREVLLFIVDVVPAGWENDMDARYHSISQQGGAAADPMAGVRFFVW
jgi:hypothetical protein